MHEHGGGSMDVVSLAIFAAVAFAGVSYVLAAVRGRRPWPWFRSALWIAGLVVCMAAVVGPLPALGHEDFAWHTVAHVLLGMVGPLLLVLAAPITLMLRSIDAVPARRMSRLLRSPIVRFFVHPVPAAVLSVGGMWLMYGTDLYGSAHENGLFALVMNVHVFLAGYLFAASMVSPDPAPHRPSFPFRAIVLVLAIAAHSILAKVVYADPPAGIPAAEGEAAGLVLYYLGDAAEVALIVVFCAQWFRATRRGRPQRVPRAMRAASVR
jgi:putative membrane protein